MADGAASTILFNSPQAILLPSILWITLGSCRRTLIANLFSPHQHRA